MKDSETNKRRLALTLAALATAALGACAGSQASPSGSAEASDTATEMQGFLSEARDAAAAYGQKHLGHYLDLSSKTLEKKGLDVPDSIEFKVTTDHKGYCIRADNSKLDSSDPWSIATVSSGIAGISRSDDCKL